MRKIVLFTTILATLLAGCGGSDATTMQPLPTRTPLPTFTPTAEIVMTPVDPAAAATAKAMEAQATVAAGNQPADTNTPGGDNANNGGQTEQPTPVPTATPTETLTEPAVTVNNGMNVRGGPGTNYPVIGTAAAGERFLVTGKNPAGDWWQVNYNGQTGWLFGNLVTAENTGGVQIAANIPAPPPTPTPQPPTPTPVPAQPTPTPAPQYKFNIAVVGRCDPNGGVTYVEGKTYVNGQPQSGDWSVAFSYAPDGPVVASVKAGPHEGYPNWEQGFYSHILQSSGPREGDWWFWVVDPSGKRISEMAHVHTDGEAGAGKCQQAVVDFDSR